MVWQAWAPVAGGVTLPGAPITALPSGEQLAVFVAGYPSPGAGTTGGAVYAIEGTPGGWGNWAPVCDHLTLTGAPVGAAKLPPPVNEMQEQFALFIADPLGGIYATDGDPQEGWWCWESVSGGQTLPGAPVTAVTWRKQAAIFFADPIGGIYANRGTPEGGWGDWRIVCGDRSTLPGAPVTALPLPTGVQRPGEELAVFMADRNGGVYATSGSVRWRCWGSVSDGIAVPGSKVTAVRWTDQQFALFVVSPNGGVTRPEARRGEVG